MNAPAIQIQNEVIPVTPSGEHEYTLPTALVAKGYGVAESNIRKHKQNHADELIEGIHFLVVSCSDEPSVTNTHARDSQRVTKKTNLKPGGGATTHWTKLGVITLGFFIRSDRAKAFRRAAAEMILSGMEQSAALPATGDPVEANLVRRIEACPADDLDSLDRLISIYRRATAPALPPAAEKPAKVTPKLILDMIPPEGIGFEDLGEKVVEATGAPWAFFWQVWTEKVMRGKRSGLLDFEGSFIRRIRQ